MDTQTLYNELINSVGTTCTPTKPKRQTRTLVAVGHYDGRDRQRWGGKVSSLSLLLRRGGLRVPRAWALPCEYTFTRPYVTLNKLPKDRLFAVRSGAPVSMPGVLSTQLNVPRNRVQKAIQAVWDSWNAPKAVEYRQATQLSDALGTGVAIQEMVPEQMLAGIAFSAKPVGTSTFDPVVEYTEGLGDKLVGGECTGTTANGQEPWHNALVKKLWDLHRECGPSDIEFAVDAYNNVWWLQWRPLLVRLPNVVYSLHNGEEALFGGVPIGAPVQVTGKLGTAEILYVDQFTPDTYQDMLKAKAILCSKGGTLCHAAIVARTLGKPAVTGIVPSIVEEHLTKRVLVDGTSGAIYFTQEDIAIASNACLPVPRMPNLRINEGIWRVEQLLVRFYQTIDSNSLTQEEKNRRIEEIAHLFASYQYIITLTELRYMYGRDPEDYTKVFEGLASHGIRYIPSIQRTEFASTIPQPASLQEAIAITQLVSEGFGFKDHGAIGGPLWRRITDHLLAYLTQQLSATLYVDGCFNIRHNTGRQFNKFPKFLKEGSNLDSLLAAKADSPEAFKVLGNRHNDLVDVESIFSGLPEPIPGATWASIQSNPQEQTPKEPNVTISDDTSF